MREWMDFFMPGYARRHDFCRAFLVLTITLMLSACGQKGPLYLAEPTTQQQSVSVPVPLAAENADEKK